MSRFDEMMKNVEAATTEEKTATYEIEITTNPSYCGIGAGGVQFASGKGITHRMRVADWYKEHENYQVTEITE